ncbi:hypothetical protein [Burkholderia glumae]|uniref:DUF4148 domain-containing protein n=1 Tax=Burkholderia glumae TaxID=337 RepID=A0AAQ0BT55_BURGL|nr:hypothetical protein [Burkholderia glumae]ACR29550.1 Hypothetical protein bglu_1g24730 [Burkholderia glumae BGR1]AJY65011.1 hypothetical protein KS03_3241 [Burkholderia glumae LMG 2196 = ATCC 33617]KHJ64511.1 hypothetical protein NCPPB3923_02425 [Burkholderia glumae]MCM2482785.1 hypothetical protein [Burkholderia glumae]MCM2490565.1 hypothetical protein [Burkholderia glumae]
MKKTISMYWPLAIIVPLAAAAYLHASAVARPGEPLAIEQASAELARTVSFGLVGASPDAASATPIAAARAL